MKTIDWALMILLIVNSTLLVVFVEKCYQKDKDLDKAISVGYEVLDMAKAFKHERDSLLNLTKLNINQ